MLGGMRRQSGRRCLYDWWAVQQHFDNGHPFVACREAFGFSHTAWVKAIKRGDLQIPGESDGFADRRHKYDWVAVQQFYDQGHPYQACRVRIGVGPASWTKAVQRGDITPRPRLAPISEVLIRSRSRTTIKRRLIQAGILSNACDDCGLREWRGKPLSIQIDHRNGVRDDHRLGSSDALSQLSQSNRDIWSKKP